MKAQVGQSVTYIGGDESETSGVVTESNNEGATIELPGKVLVRAVLHESVTADEDARVGRWRAN